MKAITYLCYVTLTVLLLSCTDKSAEIVDKGEWVKIENGEQIHEYLMMEDSIYVLNVYPRSAYKNFPAMNCVDVYTFVVCKNGNYAKDKKHVYFPLNGIDFDGFVCGGSRYLEYIVEGADPKTFKYIGNDYGVDRRNMYYKGEKIKWDDSKISKE